MKTFPVHQAFPWRASYLVFSVLVVLCILSVVPTQAQNGEGASEKTSEEPTPAAESTYRIIRDVNGSGGRLMSGARFRLHGTVSETVIGRMRRPSPTQGLHSAGFWYWAKEVESFACVRMPIVEAEPGTTLTIPVLIEQTERIPVGNALRFQARIRFNRSLLQPVGQTPECTFDGEDCILEIDVPVTAATLESGILAELRFLAKLGNAESTPLVIEEYAWSGFGEQPIRTVTKPGEFILLGVCREGGEIRLVRSVGPASGSNKCKCRIYLARGRDRTAQSGRCPRS